jgi:arsenite oxidase small subunit
MPDEEQKDDPFKPQQPRIPGVSNGPVERAAVSEPVAPARAPARIAGLSLQIPPTWILFALGGALFLGIVVAWWTHGSASSESAPSPPVAVVTPPAEPPKPVEKLPVGPGPIANTDELTKPWSARRFVFRNSATSENVPAMVIHLPSGTNWAISLREPYGNCTLEYVEDLDKIQSEYGYRAEHPMVGDPCNRSLFDLSKYGPAPSGLVRGQIIQGVAVRPPMAIEIRAKGKEIVAVRME